MSPRNPEAALPAKPAPPTPLRVLHVIPSVASEDGGPSMAMHLMEQALRAAGVHCVTATTVAPLRGASNPALPASRGKRFQFGRQTNLYKVSLPMAVWLFRRTGRFQVVHIHALFSFSSVVAAWAARLLNVPYVVRPLGVLNQYGLLKRRPALKQWSIRLIEGPILRRAHAVHVTSQAESDEIALLGLRLKTVVIPLAVPSPSVQDPSERLEHMRPLAAPRLLFLSRVDPKKNLEGLIKALRLLSEDGVQVLLCVAGSGDATYVNSLRRLAEDEQVAEQVTWLGHVTGAAKHEAFAQADLFVLPSFSENFGVAAAEALAMGLPCVLGKGVALSDQAAQAGAAVAVEPTPDAIAAGIASFLQSPSTRESASRRAREWARAEFSVEAMGHRLKDLYLSIVGDKVGAPGSVNWQRHDL